MAFFGYFLSPRKESNPPEAKKGKGDEKPSGGVEPRPYALSTEGVYVTRSGRCGHRPLRKRRKYVRYLARADSTVRPYNRLPSVRPSTKHPHHSTTSPPAAQPPLPRQLYVKNSLPNIFHYPPPVCKTRANIRKICANSPWQELQTAAPKWYTILVKLYGLSPACAASISLSEDVRII